MTDAPDATHPPTCGQGLALHARLPALIADVMRAESDVLENHVGALDLTDESSRRERAAYLRLVERHREAGDLLRSIASEMESYRTLPMGRHDMEAMLHPSGAELFAAFIASEEALAGLLREWLGQHHAMLRQMT